jgi:hypothetical protein
MHDRVCNAYCKESLSDMAWVSGGATFYQTPLYRMQAGQPSSCCGVAFLSELPRAFLYSTPELRLA